MIDPALIRQQLPHAITSTDFTDTIGPKYEGKVRDTYQRDDVLVLVTTDRISAFDHVLNQAIPFKGQVLNQLAAFFFEATAEIVPNHVIAVPDPNVTVAKRCTPVPIEFVVRGYLAGHAWRVYQAGGRVLCGERLPDGLQQNSKLPEPILTPATKAEEGHDEDISRSEILERGILDAETFDLLTDYALGLFERGSAMARQQGLILVDTKYEFGETPEGDYVVIDEIHTPDSSRYFYEDTYDTLLQQDEPQRQLSKEFVREWLMAHDFMGKPGQTLPDLPDTFRVKVAERYIELYEEVTGLPFDAEPSDNPGARMLDSVKEYFSLQ